MSIFKVVIAALGIIAVAGIFGVAIRTDTPLLVALLFAALVVMIVGHVFSGGRPL